MTISLYLKDDYNQNSLWVIEFQKDLEAIAPGKIIATVNSKEDVLADLEKRDPELVKILERDNPLPATITIEWVSLDKYEEVNDEIINRSMILLWDEVAEDLLTIETQTWANVLNLTGSILENAEEVIEKEDVYSYQSQFERINDVIFILNALKYGLYFIIWIFLLSIWVIVYSVIWNFVYYYRNEIYITKLVWGSNVFIYWPFSLQWLIYVLVAFWISIVVFLLVFQNASFIIGKDTNEFNHYIFNENFANILLIEILVFSALGIFSGYLSSKKYLKNNS